MNIIEQASGANWTLYNGDCVEGVAALPDSSVGYSIYSPPFQSLYTYSNSDRDMGNCRSAEEFYEHFAFLVPQLIRVTKPGRLMSVHCMTMPTSKTVHGYIGLIDFRGELVRLFQKFGWIFHSEVTIWKDPVTQMQRTKALGLLHKQVKKDSSMSRQGLADYLITLRKPGINDDPIAHDGEREGGAESIPVELWQRYASPVWMDINPSKTLQHKSARENEDERHICPLQLEVIERGQRLWSKAGDVVLSPFAGIGSEGHEAVRMGRKFVGFELKKSYFEQAALNLKDAEGSLVKKQLGLFGDASFA